MDTGILLKTLHLADSAYPTGSFAHSWGLEYAIYNGLVKDGATLFEWCKNAMSYSYAPLEGRASLLSYDAAVENDYDRIFSIDKEVGAMRPSENARRTAAQMGRSFVNITALSYNDETVRKLDRLIKENDSFDCMQHPVAWGAVFAWLGLPKEYMLSTLLHGVVKQWAQVAVRIIPLGQSKAHAFLAAFTVELEKIISAELINTDKELKSISPLLDISSIGHESLKARYFIN
jgi:urease accessory protein